MTEDPLNPDWDKGPPPNPESDLRAIRAKEAELEGEAEAGADMADAWEGVDLAAEDERYAGLRDEALASPGPRPTPTREDPLHGLAALANVAVMGAAKLNELADAPILWVWEGVAILGLIVVIAGKVGCGKTTLLFWILAARMNTGEPVEVLGRKVVPAPAGTFVVLIEGEHGERSTARKIRRMLRVAGVQDIDGALGRVIVVARKSVRIGSPEWADVERLVAAGLVSDIALDTIARVAPGDANDEREQVAIFDQVSLAIDKAPSEATKPIVWCAAHLRKGEGGDLDEVSGSAQRTGQADTVLFVNAERRDGQVVSSKVTFQKLREEPDAYPVPVEFTVASNEVVIVGAPAKDERPLEERILERLSLGPQTKNALSKSLGRNKADLEEAISGLFAERRITTQQVMVSGRPYGALCLR